MKTLLLGLIIIISFQSFAQNDFRKMNWGDSFTELKANYPDVKWQTETDGNKRMYYTDDIIGGLTAKVIYIFADKKLQIGAYIFEEKHSSDNLYYEDFLSISALLNKKYDMERNERWNDTTWEGNEDYIGFALMMGNVVIEETYEDEKTAISHEISGDGGINHILRYASMDYVKSLREESLDDF